MRKERERNYAKSCPIISIIYHKILLLTILLKSKPKSEKVQGEKPSKLRLDKQEHETKIDYPSC
jgi:hypothetical protein